MGKLMWVCNKTIHNVLKAACLKAMVRKERPHLSIKLRQRRPNFAHKYKDWTGPELFGQIRQKSTRLGQMDG
jgi:hypothetical protein